MKVSILIPYRRQIGDTYRSHNLQEVTARWSWFIDHYIKDAWSTGYSMFEIVVGTNGEEPFNRSAARNDAFRRSDGDVLVLCDADTLFVEHDAMAEAIDEVWRTPTWVLPYGTYWNASQSWTDRYYEECKRPPVMEIGAPETFDHRLKDTVSGVIVLRRSAYEYVGGHDERFRGWGYEDDAFAYALTAMYGRPHRLEQYNVIHLWHPRGPEIDFDQPEIEYNRALCWTYEKAARDGNMRALIESRQ